MHMAMTWGRSIVIVILLTNTLDISIVATVAVAEEKPSAASYKDSAGDGRLMIGSQPVNKVLILGNSITLHAPAPQIGWIGKWGMAASAEEKDYVHLLISRLTHAAGGTPKVTVNNVATFERQLTEYSISDNLKEELGWQADLIILAIGENVSPLKSDEDKDRFRTAFAGLMTQLKNHANPAIFVRSQFWQNAEKDQIMKEVCLEAGGTFIDVSKLGAEPANYARAEREIEHAGVGAHPGDKGMQELADAIWTAIKNHCESQESD